MPNPSFNAAIAKDPKVRLPPYQAAADALRAFRKMQKEAAATERRRKAAQARALSEAALNAPSEATATRSEEAGVDKQP